MGVAKKTRKFATVRHVNLLISMTSNSQLTDDRSNAVSPLALPLRVWTGLTQDHLEVIGQRDARLKKNAGKADAQNPEKAKTGGPSKDQVIREIPQMPSSLFFQHK
ncbi:putative rRNA-processing protein FCF1 [Rosellinia necatrix]|uniref:Putative rRNA-processing protein FCF1 n=1 Tax=Rosellinia necatrix TaxID=77044 RepID=A0A1S8A655_ROSNE|nr:putative rRNA-processing protein FCF1 [Rosellinia necatrix]